MKVPKVLSKLYRLKLTDQIRDLVMTLPTEGLRETQVGNHVYYAEGQIKIGAKSYPGKIRVWFWNRNISVSVRSDEIGFHVICPFNNDLEWKKAPKTINRALQNHLN